MKKYGKIKYIILIPVALISIIALDSLCIGADWTWSHRYGGLNSETANSALQTSDGGYIVAGITGDHYTNDWLIIKLSASGAVEWQKTYGGIYDDDPYCILQSNDGGYIVAGGTGSFANNNGRGWIMKLNSSGDIIWQKIYGGSCGEGNSIKALQQTGDGGYIAAGDTECFGMGWDDAWVLKLDSSGNIQWEKTYGGANDDGALSIQQTSDGGYIVAGYSMSYGASDADIWALKLDSSGNVQWQKTYGISGMDEVGWSAKQTTDGGYIIAALSWNIYYWGVIKLDGSGNIVWQKDYSSGFGLEPYDIQLTNDGGYIVVGRIDYYPVDIGIWVIKLDSSGNIIWQKAYNSPDWDFGYSVQQTKDGGYIIAGESHDYYNWFDFWLIKTDANGNMDSTCNFVYDTNAIPVDTYAVTMDTNVIPCPSNAIVEDTYVLPYNFDGINTLLCQASGMPVQISHKPIIDDSSSSTPNGIIEADEAVNLVGIIENTGTIAATSVTGLLTTSSPIFIINANASYPDIAPGATANVLIPYSIIAPSANRPATHWDINVTEHSSCTGCFPFNDSFIYHIGNSFLDVSPSNIFYSHIEKLLHARIISGCTNSNYCPLSNIKRDQLAKLLCNSIDAVSNNCAVSGCTGIFADVSINNPFCSYIEGLYNAGWISGCQASPLRYCPSQEVTREQIAKFICYGAWFPCEGGPCQGTFADVPASNPFCPWIEGMYNNGIISGCQASPLLYCPKNLVTREQAAKYLVNAFSFSF